MNLNINNYISNINRQLDGIEGAIDSNIAVATQAFIKKMSRRLQEISDAIYAIGVATLEEHGPAQNSLSGKIESLRERIVTAERQLGVALSLVSVDEEDNDVENRSSKKRKRCAPTDPRDAKKCKDNNNTNDRESTITVDLSAPDIHTASIELLAGIENGGNRCYLNASIKALLSCGSFVVLLQDIAENCLGERGELARLLLTLHESLQTRRLITHRRHGFEDDPSPIDAVVRLMQKMEPDLPLAGTDPQDAGELVLALLNLLDIAPFTYQQLNAHTLPFRVGSMDASHSEEHRMLPIYLSSWLRSLQDAFDGVAQKQEVDLQLVRDAPLSEKERDEFDLFVQDRGLQNENVYIVPSISSQRLIGRAPQFLPIQITRFSRDRAKSEQLVAIPYRLRVPVSQTEHKDEKQVWDEEYVLRAVIVHDGGQLPKGGTHLLKDDEQLPQGGHYRTYTARPNTTLDKSCSVWVEHSDHLVSEKQFQEIVDLATGGYIAFYEKV